MNMLLTLFLALLFGGPMNRPSELMPDILSAYTEISRLYAEEDLLGSEIPLPDIFTNADYYTPALFGARGDGKADDTQALRKALYQSEKDGKVLFFPAGAVYKVTGTLNYYNKEYRDCVLNIVGSLPSMKGSYTPQQYGGITVAEGVSLFKNATVRGSMQNVCITGKRKDSVKFFDTCTCSGLTIRGCNIANFGAMFFDTSVKYVSRIIGNSFLTVFSFAKNEKTGATITDSTISYNYINGGMEKNDNTCFEWTYFNGTLVTNNFIDYYRTIYNPVAVEKQTFVGPTSFNNQYQVFRYFYAGGTNISNISFCSYNDTFNWTDPSTLEKLQQFVPLTYKGKDGKTYEIPPYVARCCEPWQIVVRGAKVERNMKSLVYIDKTLTQYKDAVFDVEFVGNSSTASGQIEYRKGSDAPFYNSGDYKGNVMRIEGIVETVESLPALGIGWSNTVNGRKVQYNGKTYTATNIRKNGKWVAKWVDENGQEAK